jgi:hypothetical protein
VRRGGRESPARQASFGNYPDKRPPTPVRTVAPTGHESMAIGELGKILILATLEAGGMPYEELRAAYLSFVSLPDPQGSVMELLVTELVAEGLIEVIGVVEVFWLTDKGRKRLRAGPGKSDTVTRGHGDKVTS